MELLATYSHLTEAYIDKGFLESQGIPTVVHPGVLSSVYPVASAGFSPIELYVPSEDMGRAIELMRSRT